MPSKIKTEKKATVEKTEKIKHKESIGTFFLDSGAHSLYTREVIKKEHSKGYDFYETDGFWKYVDSYADFVKRNKIGIDYYANVDVIFNPKLTWKVQKYMENQHGLRPVPVVHYGTDLKWLKKYLNDGHDYIGLGGLGQEVTREQYYNWADRVYDLLCDNKERLPIVKTHGFAMTSYSLLWRYPWWSVDSASWAKSGAFGRIYLPRKKNGKYSFEVSPFSIAVSGQSPSMKKRGQHICSIPKAEADMIKEWLAVIDVPFGSCDKEGQMIEWGVLSHHAARKIANLRFFKMMCDHLPVWPWPFRSRVKKGLLL